MPEGDTILRAARTLQRAIGNKPLLAFRSPLPALSHVTPPATHISHVEARGKYLLIHFEDGRALVTHMRMTGSWHIYRPGERWQKPESRARVILETPDFVAVCFNAPVVELLSPRALARDPRLSRLGPDVLKTDFDPAEALARLRQRNAKEIGEALLLQSALAGIGNIYKSEALFISRVHPATKVSDLSNKDLHTLIQKARDLLSANLGPTPRTTRPSLTGPRYWVYARSGRPCLSCSTPIQMLRQGTAARSTYWCPTCQPTPSPPGRGPG
jgi:endonuclease-8